jgi:hypothetical protein
MTDDITERLEHATLMAHLTKEHVDLLLEASAEISAQREHLSYALYGLHEAVETCEAPVRIRRNRKILIQSIIARLNKVVYK